MRAAVFSDVHGNAVALRAVVEAARAHGVDRYWVVGDLVANGPQPVEAIELLRSLDGLVAVRGNTDRYVLDGRLTGIDPPIDQARTGAETRALVDAAAAHAWTRGCLGATGHYAWLSALPLEQRLALPDGTRVLLVHASPGRDDGVGLRGDNTDALLRDQHWVECGADLVFVGHTHRALDRRIGAVRAVNVGSVSLPWETRGATWSLVEADEHGHTITHHVVDYDRDELRGALDAAHHPTAEWLAQKLGLTRATGPDPGAGGAERSHHPVITSRGRVSS